MGYASRLNPRTQDSVSDRRVRLLLTQFPDRAAYERWLTDQALPDDYRAHLERFLPPALQAKGTV